MESISEADWKQFKAIWPVALERLSERILTECQAICRDEMQTAHERYLQMYRLIQERDAEMADGFNDYRRSTASLRLQAMWHNDLITRDELSRFSHDTQSLLLPAAR